MASRDDDRTFTPDPDKDRVVIRCTCGKRYRVSASRSGREIRCRGCDARIRVGSEVRSTNTARLLVGLGIDPEASQKRYWEEAKARSRVDRERGYRCGRCHGEIGKDEVAEAYHKGELVCAGCRAGDVVEDRARERAVEEQATAACAPPEQAGRGKARRGFGSAVAYGALFFAGLAGPLVVVAGLSPFVAMPLALALASAGGALATRD